MQRSPGWLAGAVGCGLQAVQTLAALHQELTTHPKSGTLEPLQVNIAAAIDFSKIIAFLVQSVPFSFVSSNTSILALLGFSCLSRRLN